MGNATKATQHCLSPLQQQPRGAGRCRTASGTTAFTWEKVTIAFTWESLNTPPCLLENSLGCFPKIIVLVLFAFLESTKHITSREGWGREKADDRHSCNGYAFRTSWGWGEMPQWVKYTFPWGTIMGGLKKIRWSTEGSPWWCSQGQL